MLKRHAICATFLLLVLSVSTAIAQTEVNKTSKTSAVTITASATAERVRFTAPSSVVQIRLEIYNAIGKKLSDNELRGGNVIDWLWQNGRAEPLTDDTYLCVITVKSLSGRISQRIASIKVGDGTAIVQATASVQMTAQQTEVIGPVEENTSVTVLSEDDAQTSTLLAHTGTEGQLIRGQGALSFRLGDFFNGKDKEQMRLTEEGNLGIGTATPQARLDVAGMIRTQGLILPDGSIITSAVSIGGSPDSAIDLKGTIANLGKKKKGQVHTEAFGPINGDGTTNTIAKYTGANTIANSALTEVAGKVGIGTANPGAQLHIFGTATADVFAGMGPDVINGPAFNYGYAGFTFGRGAGFFNVRPDASAAAPNPSLRFMTANVQRMIVTNVGNVGIGTTNPATSLEANGLVRSTRSGVADQYIQLNGGDSGSIKLTAQSTVGAEKSLFIQNLSGNASSGANNLIQFQLGTTASPSTKMVINQSGAVGIGTLDPGSPLDVECNGNSCINGANTSAGSGGVFSSGEGSTVHLAILAHPNVAASFAGASTFISGDSTPLPESFGPGIVMGSIPNVGYISAFNYDTNTPMTLAFQTSGGRIGINTTAPDQTLTVNGSASKPGGGSWAVFSDERLKDIKGGFTPGLKALMQLQPLRYEYKRDNALGIKSEGEHVGFGALAVRKIIPEAVMKNDKGYLLVNNDPIMWTMLNAIKEQQKQIEGLSKEVRKLRVASRRHVSRGITRAQRRDRN